MPCLCNPSLHLQLQYFKVHLQAKDDDPFFLNVLALEHPLIPHVLDADQVRPVLFSVNFYVSGPLFR